MASKQDELFRFVEYSPENAERIGYSNYSYWRSVMQNFLKRKSAVFMLFVFVGLVIFSFIALAIGKYDWATLVTNTDLAFHKPDGEYWFGCDNQGRQLHGGLHGVPHLAPIVAAQVVKIGRAHV